MSQTPLDSDAPVAKRDDGSFSDSRSRLFQMIEEGKSWSGHERNCAFLNTGGDRFATISAVSGFDFLDDARGLALTDWDHDGDLDLWITNRTAPRVRVLRNDTPSGNHFLSVRLRGTSSNRDAIGARAELTIEGEDGQRKLIKTVRAGEGFLAQSSKWLHFGLGDDAGPAQLSVRWPGGKVEQFTDLAVDARYAVVEGSGTAEVSPLPPRDVRLAASEPTLPAVTLQAAAPLPVPLPLPPLEYESFDGDPDTLAGPRDRPLLLNLWASWCLPCARELAEFTQRSDELSAAGLDILALSVDGLGGEQTTTPQDARQALAKWKFPFASGVATIGMLDKLQIVHNQLFAMHRPLPVPTSLLIDTDGRLAAIYKGPVEVEQLLADVEQLSRGGDAWRQAALPYSGRWYYFPQESLMPLVDKLFDRDYTNEAIDYALQNKPRLAGDPNFTSMLHRVGQLLAQRGDFDTAIEQFEEALTVNAEDFEAYNNLGVTLRLQKKTEEAIEQFRRAIELNPEDADVRMNLASALQLLGQPAEAIEQVRRAASLAPSRADLHNALGIFLARQQQWDAAIAAFSEAVAQSPDTAAFKQNLAAARAEKASSGAP